MGSTLDKNGAQLKYGPVMHEDTTPQNSIPMAASAIIPVGGAFSTSDGSGRASIAGAGSTLLSGWVFPGEPGLDAGKKYQTCSSTAGGTIVPRFEITAMQNVVVRLPVITGIYVATMKDKTCDLAVNNTTKQQGVALNLSSEDTVLIIDGDTVNNAWVDVVVNPSKLTGFTGVV